ncbi:MAG: hypothetical protein ACOYK1_05180 [Vampirovibrionia bacterium]
MKIEDISLYLPKYLTPKTDKQLKDEIRNFCQGVKSQQFYANQLLEEPEILQGDVIEEVPIWNYNEDAPKFLSGKILVLSNACDISPENLRKYTPNLLYSPIVDLNRWAEGLKQKFKNEVVNIDNLVKAIKNQENSNFFYLPNLQGKECFTRLDMIFNMPVTEQRYLELSKNKLACLSNFAYFLLQFKLSIHFCRTQGDAERNNKINERP